MKKLFTVLLCLVLFNCGKKDSQDADSDTISADSATSNQADTSNNKTDDTGIEVTKFTDNDGYRKIDSYLVDDPLLDTADFHLIDITCAILVLPSEKQIELMEKEYGEDFSTIADDNGFYQAHAMEVLDSIGITTVIASNRRYLRLVDGNGREWTLDIRQKGAPGWNLIFHSVNRKPKVVSSIDVNSQLVLDYFDDPQD
jgi:hypothetical protein